MPNAPLFPNAYPRAGQVALLCEGDVTGYEAQFFKLWADAVFGPIGLLVDVWACGSAAGIFSMADSIGRSKEIVVVEDRDFRSAEQAGADCDRKTRDRQERGLSIRGWRTLHRHEIENYFLDRDVLVPVLSDAFDCSEAAISACLDTAVQSIRVLQALHAGVHEVRRVWEGTDASCLLIGARPSWRREGIVAPEAGVIRAELQIALERWQSTVHDGTALMKPFDSSVMTAFDRSLDASQNVNAQSDLVRFDWPGKEILKLVRQQLCARSGGWWSLDPTARDPVRWHEMQNNRERNSHDRRIENELRPRFVQHLARMILDNPDDPRVVEFHELARLLRN